MIYQALGNGDCFERNKQRMSIVSNMSVNEIDFHLKNIKYCLQNKDVKSLTKSCENLFYETVDSKVLNDLIYVFKTYSNEEQNEIFNIIKNKIIENPIRGFFHNFYIIIIRWNKIKDKNNIKVFNNEEFGQIRTVKIKDKIYFVGIDVAKSLGYSNASKAVSTHCKHLIKTVIDVSSQNGKAHNKARKTQEMSIIPEGDVYRLIIRSKLESAQRFEEWVFDEVLPQIRKTGGYINYDKDLSDDEILSRALTIANKTIDLKNKEIRNKEEKIESMKPSVIFTNAVRNSDDTILIGDMAKILMQNGVDIGEKRLFAWLRDNGYLIKRKGSSYNMPTQYSMNLDLFKIHYSIKNNKIIKTSRVTTKGQIYFVNKFVG